MFNNVGFAEELKEVRERKGIDINTMARKLNRTTRQIRRIECGQNITIYTLAQYLEVIGLDILDVFRE